MGAYDNDIDYESLPDTFWRLNAKQQELIMSYNTPPLVRSYEDLSDAQKAIFNERYPEVIMNTFTSRELDERNMRFFIIREAGLTP